MSVATVAPIDARPGLDSEPNRQHIERQARQYGVRAVRPGHLAGTRVTYCNGSRHWYNDPPEHVAEWLAAYFSRLN